MEMTFADIFKAVDELTPTEIQQLREYIDQKDWETRVREELSPEERWRGLDEAFASIREGFTDEELAALERDINAEYIEPWDESEWSQQPMFSIAT
jgi:hypothetical protein